MKRNISFILTLTMILSAFPISPYAQDAQIELPEYGREIFDLADEYEADFDSEAELFAASPFAVVSDFENEEEGELSHGYRGENFIINNDQPEIDSFGICSEDGNKFARISNAAYDGSSSSRLVYNAVKTGDVLNLSYRIRFVDKAPVHWIPVNIGENNVSATYFNNGVFGINYGGDFARNPRAQAKYKNYSVDLFKPRANIWYTVSYMIDFADQSYDLSVTDADGNSQIADSGLATGVPFRSPNGSITAANMGECRFYIPHNAAWNKNMQPGEATTAEYVYDVDDIMSSTDEKAAALKAFNAADADSIGDVIRKFADVLELDCEGEYAVKSAYIDYLVANEIPFATADDIKTAFDNAVEKAATINGDFTRKTLLEHSADTVLLDFEDCTPGMSDSTINGDGYSAFLMADGKVGYVRENGSTYLCLDQNAGKEKSNTIYLQYKLPDFKKATVSYRVRIDKLNPGWTTFYIGGASNLYLLDNKFSLNMGSSQPNISGTVTAGVWYTVVSDFDIAAQKYNLKIAGDDGTTLVDMKDVAYRNSVSQLGNLTIGCAQSKSASKICIDDIKTVSYAKDDLFFSVRGTKSLLPGENRYDVDFMNISKTDRQPTLYLFVYKNDELVGIETQKFDIANGSALRGTMTVTTDAADYGSGDEFCVLPYMLDSLSGGLNYGADTAFGGIGEINASVTTDYDEHKFVICGDMPFDVLRVLILAPGKTETDAIADPKNIVYFAAADSLENINFSAEIADRFGSGDYRIYLVSQNGGGTAFEKEFSVYYCGNSVADGIAADFRSITESNAESIMNKYINTYPIMNDFDNFSSFYEANKSTVNEILIGSKSKINKVSDVKELLGVAYVVAALQNSADEAEFEALFETNGALFGIDITDIAYTANKAETVSRLFAKRTALTSANIASEFDTALMLAEFNGADRTTIESVLTKYKSVTGIDTASAAYINNKANVNKALTADGAVFNSVADIVAAYNSALSASGSSGVAGGGGGGGGSKVTGGGFGSNSTITVDKPYVEPDAPLTTNSDEFCDLGSAEWARESIMRLRARGVINGVDAAHFEPDRFVTREEFAKMIACAFGINGGAANFDDVDGAQWYAPFVAALFSNGIVNGISETSFGVGSGISRQDAAVILDRTAAHMGKTLEYDVSALNTFGDYIAPYARDSVLRLYQSGIVSGVSEKVFDAEGTLTRAQAAKLIDGLVQLAK